MATEYSKDSKSYELVWWFSPMVTLWKPSELKHQTSNRRLLDTCNISDK